MRKLLCALVLTGCLVLSGCAFAFAADDKVYSIGGAGAGGGYYIMGGSIGNILSNNGIQARVQTTGGGMQNAVLVDKGEINFGFANNIEINEQYQKSDTKNVRAIITAFPGVHHFMVRADQPINAISEISGQVYGLTAKGSTHDIAGLQMFDILGVKPRRIVNADRSDSGNMVQDGLITGYFMTSGVPISSIMELETNADLRFLEFSDEEYATVKEKAPWLSEAVIPAGSYKAVTKDIKTFGSWNIMIAGKDVEEEVVYNILKLLFDNAKIVTDTYSAAEFSETAIMDAAVPLHAGAVKFYRERGVTIPDRLIPDEAK